MAQASSSTPAALPSSGKSVRIVLFGMPTSGKSSMLGALAQAAQTQERTLNGRLIDPSNRLLELQRRLYEDRPRETLEEIAPYEVSLQPLDGKPGAAAANTVSATLVDCDGRVANELLDQKELAGNGRALTRAVLDADTLVLAVDASKDTAVLNRDFGQFAKFLRTLERSRGQRTEVGGLPVYLVLTKCDLLAQKTDTTVTWMERIEERKRKVDRRFQEFLAQQAEREHQAFGKIDLHLWATAVKRPALADTPARPRDPYGVAELFRQCLASATAYRERRAQAGKRLTVAVGAILGVLAVLVLLMLVLVLGQPTPEATALNDEVRRYLSANDKPAERLKDVGDKLKHLQKIKDNPDFSRLSKEHQDRVDADLAELTAFKAYADQLNVISEATGTDLNQLPAEDAEKELATIREKLQKLAPPEKYEAAWALSPAGQRRQHWLKDLEALDREQRRVAAKYEDLLKRGEDLRIKFDEGTLNKPVFKQRASELLAEAERLQLPDDSERFANRTIPNASEVTYSLLFRLASVRAAYLAWGKTKKYLEDNKR